MPADLEHHGLAPTFEQLAGIDRLIWRAPTSDRAELHASGLRRLIVEGINGPLAVRLPPTIDEISLSGALHAVHVDGLAGPDTLVQLWGDVSDGLPSGISQATRLEISDTAELDLAPLSEMTALRELTVRNVSGRVSNCSALTAAAALERIAFFRCYHVDAAGFPAHTTFSRLGWIAFDDISSADAKILRARVEGFWNGHVRHPRSRAWLNAHNDNPFRTWADDAPELGHHASTHWRRTKARLLRATTKPQQESAIRHLADAIDRLTDDWPLDTLRREQAGEAVRGLAGEHLPPTHPLTRWEPA